MILAVCLFSELLLIVAKLNSNKYNTLFPCKSCNNLINLFWLYTLFGISKILLDQMEQTSC